MATPLPTWKRLPPSTFRERFKSSRETKDQVTATQFSKAGDKREPKLVGRDKAASRVAGNPPGD